jgi:hypothetical protein
MTAKRKRRSGPTQPESERKAVQVLLRLTPWHRDQLRKLSKSDGYTMSEWVQTWIEMQARGEI